MVEHLSKKCSQLAQRRHGVDEARSSGPGLICIDVYIDGLQKENIVTPLFFKNEIRGLVIK